MEKNEIQDESFDEIEETDDTDWKSETIKLREKAIRQREKTKELREQVKAHEAKLSEFEKSNKTEIKTDEFGLLQKTYLRAAGIVAEDEVELAKSIQKKTGVEWDALVDDDYFKTKLEGLRTAKANADATSDIKGDGGGASKNSLEYYLAKGEAPVHDKKLHLQYIQERKKREGASMGAGKRFYND